MKTINVFSKKVGHSINAKVVANKKQTAIGWMNSGWSKSGGWCVPPSK